MREGFDSTSTRRNFLVSAGAVAGAAAFSPAPARAAAKYRRYNVTSPEGQRALASYAKGVEAMLRLPPSHPHNWFRNAFVHLMDCPHGNWWFYVWHRGYLGFFERTIRSLSGDESFAMPYWDWTQLPRIPDGLFDGVLTPVDKAFERYTGNLAVFTSFIKPTLNTYWNSLSAAQRAQLTTRGYNGLDDLWNDVTGYNPAPAIQAGISGNMAYAITCGARYLSRGNPKLDPKTAYDVSPFIVNSGLAAREFYNPDNRLSFNSSKTPSHNTAPSGATKFSILEGFPHNKVHNYIGGVGPVDPGPYGNMTNFLSPVDPIFFLHHSNMDRLWDVWTRKQKRLGLPYLPTGADLKTLSEEPFLFFVDGNGGYVTNGKAGNYLSTEVFGYDYQPGFGEALLRAPHAALTATKAAPIAASVHANTASVVVPRAVLQRHLAGAAQPLVVEITLPRPAGTATAREFDVLVNAPAGITQVGADSPYYAGTVAFFGPVMHGMKMSTDATFTVPLRPTLHAFTALGAASSATLNVRVVPSHGRGSTPTLRALSVIAP
jgi:tyrosinase